MKNNEKIHMPTEEINGIYETKPVEILLTTYNHQGKKEFLIKNHTLEIKV